MRVIVGCECSGAVRDAFAARGHDAWSCDLKPSENGGNHYQGDIFDIIDDGWDLGIFHPPCTFMCSSGLHWNGRIDGRDQLTDEALQFTCDLMNAKIEKMGFENPVGCISTRIGWDGSKWVVMPKEKNLRKYKGRKSDQIIQPYEFGDDASKATALWLKNLPLLRGTKYFPPRIVEYKGKKVKRWSNQTDSGQNKLPPSEHRATERSRTYKGIAEAMADQWGGETVVYKPALTLFNNYEI